MTTMHDACFLQENIYDSWKNHEKPKKEWKKANRFAVFWEVAAKSLQNGKGICIIKLLFLYAEEFI